MRWKFDVVVVSDLHLGARNSRPQEFLEFLSSIDAERLIIAGDLFDCPRLRGLAEGPVAVLEALRALARRIDVTWVLGNHDPSADWCQAVLGLTAVSHAWLRIDGRAYLVCHGHDWDDSLRLPSGLVSLADTVYRGCQWLDPTHTLARQLKYRSKRFLSVIDRLQNRATAYARTVGAHGMALGHTHSISDIRTSGVHYLNAGCWTERPASFIGVRHGRARPYLWNNEVYPYEPQATPDRLCRAPLPMDALLPALGAPSFARREMA